MFDAASLVFCEFPTAYISYPPDERGDPLQPLLCVFPDIRATFSETL
jgi:hypothetical protein